MSLTGFNRLRRLQQEEAMKPENIQEPKEEPIVEQLVEIVEPKEEKVEEVKDEPKTPTARRRNTRRN